MNREEILNLFPDGKVRIRVKAGARKNRIAGFDESKKALVVEVKERAEDNKANIEIIKFFSKLLKGKVRIKSGLTSKEKVIVFS